MSEGNGTQEPANGQPANFTPQLIFGGGGNDTILYSAGEDLNFGGAGNDTYQAGDGTVPEGANGRGSVTFFGGAGSHDKADYSQLDKALEVDFSVDIGSVHLTFDKETPWAVTLKHEGGEEDKFVEVEDFIGTRFGDTFKYKPSDGLFNTVLDTNDNAPLITARAG